MENGKKTFFTLVFAIALFSITGSALADSWTTTTSEEYPPITLNNRNVISGINCIGSYCDNIQLRMHYFGSDRVHNHWTSYFSEEGTNSRVCAANHFVTGVACKGSYCDNVSLQCSTFSGVTTGSCYWTGWFSEESGVVVTPAGYYMTGMQCSGSYCDNKRIRYCQAL